MTHLTAASLTRPEWMVDAACRGSDPALFYPEDGGVGQLDEALSICARCPVTVECLAYALSIERTVGSAPFGVWGATSAHQRSEIMRRKPVGGTTRCSACGQYVKRIETHITTAHGQKPRPPCGTVNGYWAHRRRDEPPCRRCKEGRAAYARDLRRRRAAGAA